MLGLIVLVFASACSVASASASNAIAAQLPEVESVLTKATGKMQDFAAEASAMQARVAEKQKASREALAHQKAKYEQKLQAQAEQNSALGAANVGIQKTIASLESGNAELRTQTEHLQQDNAAMRTVLTSVQAKVKAAALFLSDSLRVTDDSQVEELNVLEPPKPLPTLEHFLEVSKSEPLAPSLLQVSAKHTKGNPEAPEDLVEVLSSSLADIASAEREGEAELKAHFLAAYETGSGEHEKLLATQAALNATQSKLEALQKELSTAKAHLEGTRQQLQQRLHGLRVFARKVDASSYTALKSVEPPKAPAAAAPAAVAPVNLLAKAKKASVTKAVNQKKLQLATEKKHSDASQEKKLAALRTAANARDAVPQKPIALAQVGAAAATNKQSKTAWASDVRKWFQWR